jgi:hypothetical protein
LPLKIDLGEVVQGAMLIVLGFILIVIWFLARVLSIILPFGSPESFLFIGTILFLGGIGLALTGFRYRRRKRY